MKNCLKTTFLVGMFSLAASASPSPKNQVKEIRAFLFFNDSGTLSQNLFEKKVSLWNTNIGEGFAMDQDGTHHPSEQTLVTIEISGKETSTPANRLLLEINELDGKKKKNLVKLDQSVSLDGDTGKTILPFLLQKTGCALIEIIASMPVSKQKPMRKIIEFNCGE
jgi:hypothetical protein